MDNPVVIALVVSGIGMLLLFLALTLLCGLMYLMTWATAAPTPVEDQSEGDKEAGSRGREVGEQKRRAALIAVSLARAEQELSPVYASEAWDAERPVVGWRVFHRQRQLARNIPPRRAQ